MIDLSKSHGYKTLERKASTYLSRVYVDSGDLKKASIVLKDLVKELHKIGLDETVNYLNTRLDLGGIYQR